MSAGNTRAGRCWMLKSMYLVRNKWAASCWTPGACLLWSLSLFLALPSELVSHFPSPLKRSSLENSIPGCCVCWLLWTLRTKSVHVPAEIFLLTADSVDSPWVLKVRLVFFLLRFCWGYKPWWQMFLLEMLWAPLECGCPRCCSTCGLHSSSISLYHTCDKDKELRSCLFLQGESCLDCLEERISYDDGQAERKGSLPIPITQVLAQEAVSELKVSVPTLSLGLRTPDVNSSSLRTAMKGQTYLRFFPLCSPPFFFFFL